jgi:hypothetical protein
MPELPQAVPLPHPLTWAQWILHVLQNNPSRIFDLAERAAFVERYWAEHPRLDGRQRRRGGDHAAQGGTA